MNLKDYYINSAEFYKASAKRLREKGDNEMAVEFEDFAAEYAGMAELEN